MTRRQYAGGAAATAITTPIASSGGGTVSIITTTGWPDGAVGKFHVVIDPGNSSEEKILCDLRSGTTISFSSGGRGADGTVSTSHSAGAQIWLCYTALDADEANAHINAATAAHAASAISFAPTGAIAATTVQAAIAELDTDSDARLDTIEGNVTAIQAINWVTQPRIADASVGTAELIDDAVTGAKIANAIITRSTAMALSASPALVTWEAEASDPASLVTFSTTDITIAGTGLYAVGGEVTYASAVGGGAAGQLLMSGGTAVGPSFMTQSDGLKSTFGTLVYLRAADVVQLKLFLTVGGPFNANAVTMHITRLSA